MARLMRFLPEEFPRAAEVIRSGGLIVYPTDTVYGLGCDPHNASAVEKVFRAKGRESKPLPVLCDSLATASSLVELGQAGTRLARISWPGGLTIVARLLQPLPDMLHQGTGNIGVRVPGSDLCRSLIAACGGSLVGTSANLAGEKPCTTAAEAEAKLGQSVDLVFDGGELRGTPSTVVDVTGPEVRILRQGKVGVD